MAFVKIHGELLDSSVWSLPHATRIVWVTMLAMADQNGIVAASVDGLARRAVVTLKECETALKVFLGPDKHSRDGTTGERIEKVPGGWLVLNHAEYRDRRTTMQIATAERVRRHRERHPPKARIDGPVEETRRGEIYAIQRGADGPIKVGFSDNPAARLDALQTSVPERLRIVATAQGHHRHERRIHRALKALGLWVSGEWYANDPRVLAAVTSAANGDVTPHLPTSPPEAEAEAEPEADNSPPTPRGGAGKSSTPCDCGGTGRRPNHGPCCVCPPGRERAARYKRAKIDQRAHEKIKAEGRGTGKGGMAQVGDVLAGLRKGTA